MARICFVCLGNICRSPTAEAVMRQLVKDAGRSEEIAIDSAGTGAWHVGESPDERARALAKRRGIPMEGSARQFKSADFARFDHVIAMDRENLKALQRMAPDEEARTRIRLLRSFDPDSPPSSDVPDPYYGGPDGFDHVFDICEAACKHLLTKL